MMNISKKTITMIDSILKLDVLQSSTFLEKVCKKRIKVEDIDFSKISSYEVRYGIVLSLVMFSDDKKINTKVRRLKSFISSSNPEALSNFYTFIQSLHRSYTLTDNTTIRAEYCLWIKGLILSDLFTQEGTNQEKFIKHCSRFGIIDLIALEILTKPIDEVKENKVSWYHDIAWLSEENKILVSGFIYEVTSKGTLSTAVISRNIRNIVKLKANAIQNCSCAEFISLISKKYPDSTLAHYLLDHWNTAKVKEDPSEIYKLDIWLLKWFPHNREEQPYPTSLNFSSIQDSSIKKIIKKYIYYLITVKCLSNGRIDTYLRFLTTVSNDFNNHFLSISQKEAIEYCSSKYLYQINSGKTKKNANAYISEMITVLTNLFDYLYVHDHISFNPWVLVGNDYKRNIKQVNRRAIPSYVLMQMFKLLPEYPDEKYRLVFLIMFDTGLRVSDATALKKNDLVIHGKFMNGRFKVTSGELHYHNHKFNHESTVILSSSLAILLEEYRTLFPLKKDNPYLFQPFNSKNGHISSNTFQQTMRKWFAEKGVKNEDGTIFNFQSHGLRHTVAVRMKKAGIPIEAISAQLDHQSIQMTQQYIDSIDDDIKSQNKDYTDSHTTKFQNRESFRNDELEKKYVEKAIRKIRAQLLPNGQCRRPSSLKACPHYCNCVFDSCPHFRTSKDYLPIHKEQLRQEMILLKNASSKDEAKIHERNIQKLESIIKTMTQDNLEVSKNEEISIDATIQR